MSASGDRGIRNNNPGNIRHVSGVTWQGEAETQTDPAFVQFVDPVYGIRAIVRIMHSYQREGLKTVMEIINRWAPPNENNSTAYVAAVASSIGCRPTDPLNFDTVMPLLVEAIILHENGSQPYTEDQISRGIALAA